MIKKYLEFLKEQYSQYDFLLSDEKITEDEYKLMRRRSLKKTENYLNENFTGFIKTETRFGEYYFNVIKWRVPKNAGLILYYRGYFVNRDYIEVYGSENNIDINNFGSIIKIKIRERIKKLEIDPFGEEIWYE